MKTYDFEVILAAGTDMSEELADRLFEAGCDDGTPGVCGGVPVIGFSREADCLESAIRSAVADVQKAGCVVERVQIEHDSPLLSSGGLERLQRKCSGCHGHACVAMQRFSREKHAHGERGHGTQHATDKVEPH